MARNANIRIIGKLACRFLRVGEEMKASDKMFTPMGELVPIRRAMIGHTVHAVRDGEDVVLRLCSKAPAGYSVRDFKTEFHAYRGGECIGQAQSKDEAIGACYRRLLGIPA